MIKKCLVFRIFFFFFFSFFMSTEETIIHTPRLPMGASETADRSTECYKELEEEVLYLQRLKEMWKEKLVNLKKTHGLLSTMKNMPSESVVNNPPLFSQGLPESSAEVEEKGFVVEEDDDEETRKALAFMWKEFGEEFTVKENK
ncbi:hypothetical protein BY458DRAFT_14914 [Sporodiniella umbellata]|nr:hypothetical protein BY458DRAFT_14914 [Sporodiniella umbellata]